MLRWICVVTWAVIVGCACGIHPRPCFDFPPIERPLQTQWNSGNVPRFLVSQVGFSLWIPAYAGMTVGFAKVSIRGEVDDAVHH